MRCVSVNPARRVLIHAGLVPAGMANTLRPVWNPPLILALRDPL
jgi:hypothetical protein